jgi:flagellar basal-body rod modification protein FlgD
LHELDLGSQASGLVGFSWTSIPPEVLSRENPIQLEVTANTGDGQKALQPSVFAKVLATSAVASRTNDIMLDVQDYGEIATSNITKFR